MNGRQVQLNPLWLQYLQEEFSRPYMQQLSLFLRQEKRLGKIIYPPAANIFSALDQVSPKEVRVVIVGQDPYHGPNQAHGLCFSVQKGVQVPPSLKNIYQELETDLNCSIPQHGDLSNWAEQGVLLLNSVLTVEGGRAASHQGKGWEQFSDAVIDVLNQHRQHLVFMLWGSYAQKKGAQIDRQKHLVLMAPHPSPLSAHRGFFGCRHFSQANQYLTEHEKTAIDWQIR